MTRWLGVAATIAVLLAAGCGGGGDNRAESVALYIEHVNRVQGDLAKPLVAVARANQDLRQGKKLASLRPRLERSATTIQKVERRLDALQPPPEAVRLDRLIRETVHGEWQLAHEFAQLAEYTPPAGRALARAAAAGAQVRASLRGTKTPVRQAEALETYADALDSVTRSLEQLDPPPVVVPERTTQIDQYTRIAASSRGLAAALRSGKGIAPQLRGLEAAIASGSTVSAQKARIAGIRAFNRRIAAVRTVAAKAQRERTRLQTELR